MDCSVLFAFLTSSGYTQNVVHSQCCIELTGGIMASCGGCVLNLKDCLSDFKQGYYSQFFSSLCKASGWILSVICIALMGVVLVHPKHYHRVAFWIFSNCLMCVCTAQLQFSKAYTIFDMICCKYSCLRIKVSPPCDLWATILSRLNLQSVWSVSDVIQDFQRNFLTSVTPKSSGFFLNCKFCL